LHGEAIPEKTIVSNLVIDSVAAELGTAIEGIKAKYNAFTGNGFFTGSLAYRTQCSFVIPAEQFNVTDRSASSLSRPALSRSLKNSDVGHLPPSCTSVRLSVLDWGGGNNVVLDYRPDLLQSADVLKTAREAKHWQVKTAPALFKFVAHGATEENSSAKFVVTTPPPREARVVSLDPGATVFLTSYEFGSDDGVSLGLIDRHGDDFKKKLHVLQRAVDCAAAASDKTNGTRQHAACLRTAVNARARLRAYVSDMHNVVIDELFEIGDIFLIPDFNIQQLTQKSRPDGDSRLIGSSVARDLYSMRHGDFKKRLAARIRFRPDKALVAVTEEYTSAQCRQCGVLKQNLGGAKTFRCANPSCRATESRDGQAAKSILMLSIIEARRKLDDSKDGGGAATERGYKHLVRGPTTNAGQSKMAVARAARAAVLAESAGRCANEAEEAAAAAVAAGLATADAATTAAARACACAKQAGVTAVKVYNAAHELALDWSAQKAP
jgi:hypothetical protein